MATLVIEAIQTAVPLRRCSARIGRTYRPPAGATACSAAQLGVAQCPCAGAADAGSYGRAVDVAAAALRGDTGPVRTVLVAKMTDLAGAQRYEDAASVRDRLSALLGAARRHLLVEALREAGRCAVRRDGVTWVVHEARLVDVRLDGSAAGALPVEPPEPPVPGRPLARTQVDEALCLARHFEQHAERVQVVECEGTWRFPVAVDDELPRLDRRPRTGQDASANGPTTAPSRSIPSTLA
jgi:DNA polymerase-3 subunit epsilon